MKQCLPLVLQQLDFSLLLLQFQQQCPSLSTMLLNKVPAACQITLENAGDAARLSRSLNLCPVGRCCKSAGDLWPPLSSRWRVGPLVRVDVFRLLPCLFRTVVAGQVAAVSGPWSVLPWSSQKLMDWRVLKGETTWTSVDFSVVLCSSGCGGRRRGGRRR